MKKWKSVLIAVPFWLLIIALVVIGIVSALKDIRAPQSGPEKTDMTSVDLAEPKNIIQIGDSFECCPDRAEGHLLCTVTDVRLVTEESQCPPKEAFCGNDVLSVHGSENERPKDYRYEEWFVEGGAFDQGAGILLVDISVTNVDAVAWFSDGTFTATTGYFHDSDAFHAYSFVTTADMSKVEKWPDGSQVVSDWLTRLIYFSRTGEYNSEELHDTPGQELYALQIPIGQTVSFTLGYSIDGYQNGAAPDLSDLWFTVQPGRNITTEGLRNLETSIFIDTKLGRDEG